MTSTETRRQHILSAYHFAKQSLDLCHDSEATDTPANKTAALAMTARCVSHYAAAAAIFLSDPDDDDASTPAILKQFQRVTAEIQKVINGSSDRTPCHMELNYLEDLLHENGYC